MSVSVGTFNLNNHFRGSTSARTSRPGRFSELTLAIEFRDWPTRPPTTLSTERFHASGERPVHTLTDQVWLSPALAPTLKSAFIKWLTKLAGDVSDHDQSRVVLSS